MKPIVFGITNKELQPWDTESCNKEYEDHEKNYEHKEYLHHQPPVRRNTAEVLQQLTLRTFHIR